MWILFETQSREKNLDGFQDQGLNEFYKIWEGEGSDSERKPERNGANWKWLVPCDLYPTQGHDPRMGTVTIINWGVLRAERTCAPSQLGPGRMNSDPRVP